MHRGSEWYRSCSDALLTSYVSRCRPTTRSNSERTFTSRNLSQKHAIAYRRAAAITARYDSFPAIVSSSGKRCVTSQHPRTGEKSEHSGFVEDVLMQDTSKVRIQRCVCESGRLSVSGTSYKRIASGAYQRQKEINYFNVDAVWPLALREDGGAPARIGTTDLTKLYTELRMTVKLSPLPIMRQLKPLYR